MVTRVGKIRETARGGPFLAGLAPEFGKHRCSHEASESEKKRDGAEREMAAKNRAGHGDVKVQRLDQVRPGRARAENQGKRGAEGGGGEVHRSQPRRSRPPRRRGFLASSLGYDGVTGWVICPLPRSWFCFGSAVRLVLSGFLFDDFFG